MIYLIRTSGNAFLNDSFFTSKRRFFRLIKSSACLTERKDSIFVLQAKATKLRPRFDTMKRRNFSPYIAGVIAIFIFFISSGFRFRQFGLEFCRGRRCGAFSPFQLLKFVRRLVRFVALCIQATVEVVRVSFYLPFWDDLRGSFLFGVLFNLRPFKTPLSNVLS